MITWQRIEPPATEHFSHECVAGRIATATFRKSSTRTWLYPCHISSSYAVCHRPTGWPARGNGPDCERAVPPVHAENRIPGWARPVSFRLRRCYPGSAWTTCRYIPDCDEAAGIHSSSKQLLGYPGFSGTAGCSRMISPQVQGYSPPLVRG